jgi:flagellar protein FlaF
VADEWAVSSRELEPALTFNRRIWTILATSATADDNPLPEPIKVAIANLAAYVFQRTLNALAEPAPEKLGILVRINREIAAGLRASSGTPMAAAAA